MDKKDLNRLNHMLDASKTICQHIASKRASDLEDDRLLLGGIIRELLLIGEAANAISQETQKQISTIPWRMVIGMRNQLIHSYFDISHLIIWSTATEDIPKLINALQKILH
jgi:uncharacterized protein with HEPN domain